eukprot:TRINITY_DN37744_c0_g1_i1.p1 TRINITY_DN37744_c0_g1~~TRINITY_DN37744_c0_g1_i1.p1  ORF type:complete len:283 (-),score=55.14 TRINITY_DN37744_c0_g1_i1:294-1142(-)
MQSLRMPAEAKGLTLAAVVESGVPACVTGDDMRLRQVLLNVMNNGIKFTAEGGVRLTVKMAGQEICFSVADTGMGIPAERRQRVFEPFRQGDGGTARQFGGTGLGLSISRRLVELMGGRIWVESPDPETGVGSVFHFTVRMDAVAGPEVRGNAPARVSGGRRLRILLAEDNRVNQVVAVRLLEKAGHTVEVAVDGERAVQMLEAGGFDCILMDVQMPGMDGIEATKRIRAMGNRIPILALTANAMRGDRDKCVAAGMDGYIVKPFEIAALERELRVFAGAED